jgi:hypothetical protein
MTKEYLKMEDAFVHDSVEALEQHIYAGYMSKHYCEYAAHAINSHDELVAEVERLRGAIQDAFIDGCQVGWDMTGEGYNAEYGGPDNGRLHEEFSAIFTERYDDKTMSLA